MNEVRSNPNDVLKSRLREHPIGSHTVQCIAASGPEGFWIGLRMKMARQSASQSLRVMHTLDLPFLDSSVPNPFAPLQGSFEASWALLLCRRTETGRHLTAAQM